MPENGVFEGLKQRFKTNWSAHPGCAYLLCYLFSGDKVLISAANSAWTIGSIGLCLTCVLAGSLPMKLSFFQFLEGRTGLEVKPPPQFGHTVARTVCTQLAQKVHS